MGEAGYVYMLHGKGTHYVKVGKTSNILKRFTALEGQSMPFALQLLSVQLVPDMDAAEAALHERYKAYHTRGDWFALPRELILQWPVDAPLVPVIKDIIVQGYSTQVQQMLALLATADTLAIPQLCEAMEITGKKGKNKLHQQLFRLLKAGHIGKTKRGEYYLCRPRKSEECESDAMQGTTDRPIDLPADVLQQLLQEEF